MLFGENSTALGCVHAVNQGLTLSRVTVRTPCTGERVCMLTQQMNVLRLEFWAQPHIQPLGPRAPSTRYRAQPHAPRARGLPTFAYLERCTHYNHANGCSTQLEGRTQVMSAWCGFRAIINSVSRLFLDSEVMRAAGISHQNKMTQQSDRCFYDT